MASIDSISFSPADHKTVADAAHRFAAASIRHIIVQYLRGTLGYPQLCHCALHPAFSAHGRGGDFGGSQLVWGVLAFQIGRKTSQQNPGPCAKLVPVAKLHPACKALHSATFLGVSAKLDPRASAKFPAAKFTTANLTWHELPPPPPLLCLIQHTGPHGHDGLVELMPWSWPSGSHGAPTPFPGWSWGSEPGSGLKLHIALVEGQHRDAPLACTVGLTDGERPDPRTPVWPYRLNRETWQKW